MLRRGVAGANPARSLGSLFRGGADGGQSQRTRGAFGSAFDNAAAFAKKHWFTLSLPCMVYATQQSPDTMRKGGTLGYERYKDAFVAGIFLASGLSIPLTSMRATLRMWNVHLFTQGMCFGAAPAFFYFTAPRLQSDLGLPPAISTGWILLGTLPTSIGVSIAVTRVAGGSIATTLLNSAAGNLMGVFLTPMLCEYASGTSSSVPVSDAIVKLLLLVAMPSLVGMAVRHKVAVAARYDRVWSLMQPLCLLTVLAHVFSNAFHEYRDGIPGFDATSILKLFAACIAANALLTTIALLASAPMGFPAAERVAASFCAAQKTTAMGLPMMTTMYGNDPQLGLLTLPLLCYHPVQAAVGGVYAAWLRTLLRL
uniref:Sodium/bile acid cotransporter n=1 Tax=Neobodo designis TaxID=312471 RepID=A0A7S1PKY9_NEODS